MLTVGAEIIRQMQDHAIAGYPGECCGLLFARGGADDQRATRALPMENIQDKLHAADPEANPRTSRNGFQMNALKMRRQVDDAAKQGERLLGIFHSHIDCDAYFSQEDQDMALGLAADRPEDAGLWHVVVACYPDGIRRARAFRWDGAAFAPHDLPGFARTVSLLTKHT